MILIQNKEKVIWSDLTTEKLIFWEIKFDQHPNKEYSRLLRLALEIYKL